MGFMKRGNTDHQAMKLFRSSVFNFPRLIYDKNHEIRPGTKNDCATGRHRFKAPPVLLNGQQKWAPHLWLSIVSTCAKGI